MLDQQRGAFDGKQTLGAAEEPAAHPGAGLSDDAKRCLGSGLRRHWAVLLRVWLLSHAYQLCAHTQLARNARMRGGVHFIMGGTPGRCGQSTILCGFWST